MNEDYKCKFCGTGRPPTEMKHYDTEEKYLFCSVCKNELALEETLDRTVDELEISIDILDDSVYYDEDKEYVIMLIEDWQKILRVLKQIGSNLTIKNNK